MGATAYSNLTLGVVLTATIAQYTPVTAAGALASAAGNALGFTETGGVTGARVPVIAGGTAIATAAGAIALGAAVEVAASGQVTTKSAGITVGRALTAATTAGDLIEVLVIAN